MSDWQLITGDWRDHRDVIAAAGPYQLITDPPYSKRTHEGQRSGAAGYRSDTGAPSDCAHTANIGYADIGDQGEEIAKLAATAEDWACIFSDHEGCRNMIDAVEALGMVSFAPVVWVKPDSPPRLAGDGPASQCEYITVARPRKRVKRHGSRPGYYIHNINRGAPIVGTKPVNLMRALIRDYSEPGDLILDLYAGTGSTLIAAMMEGRRALGFEINPETADHARARLQRGWTPDLFGEK